MNYQLIPYVPTTEFKEERQSQNTRETIIKYLYHWPLFLVSITICLVLAFIYLRYTDPVYDVQARILFKSDESGRSSESGLNELNFVPTNKTVENEMEVLKSRKLLGKVVDDLQLWITYEKLGRVSVDHLYKNEPFRLTLVKGSGVIVPGSFDVTIKDNERFVLKDGEEETEFSYSSRLKNQSGLWKLEFTGDLNKYIGETIRISINNPEVVTEKFLEKLTTSVVNKEATVVELSMKETIPERGKDVLNSLIAVYNQTSVQEKNKVTESTLNFVDERLASLKKELNGIEKDVESFKSSRGLTDIPLQSTFFLENFKDNDNKLNEVNVQIQVINGVERYVNSPGSNKPPATVGLSDPGLVRLIEQLIALELQRDKLLATTPEGHPAFASLNRQINTTQESIRENIHGIKSSLLATRRKLQSYNDRVEASIRRLPGQEREYINIKRQQSTKEELYVYLLKKREEAALSYASTLADSRTVDNAHYSYPVSPKVPLVYAMAFFLGLAFPAGIIFGKDFLNNKVTSTGEIEATSVPILGELVYQQSHNAVVMFDKDNRILAEQFRILRTNLQYLQGRDENSRVTMLTSSRSGEGKSFIVCNLGASLALLGRKTIILDLDLRNPSISEYFNLPAKKGICSYLSGEASREEIIQSVDGHGNLFVISTGLLPSNPSEMLEKAEVKEYIEWLKLSFDEILIDTPPLNLVADGMIISRYCDVNLYVMRQAFTNKSQLKYVSQLHRSRKLRNLNIIFNGVKIGGRYSYKQDFDYTYYSGQRNMKRLL